MTALINLFYTVYARFFIIEDVVETIWSAEGVRLGYPLGSFGFDLAEARGDQGARRSTPRGLTQHAPAQLTCTSHPLLSFSTSTLVANGASCPLCPQDRIRAFHRRLRLPMCHNEAGLVVAAAFAGSVIAYADRVLPLHLDGLTTSRLSALQARLAPLRVPAPSCFSTLFACGWGRAK
jgi:hypothetical protein